MLDRTEIDNQSNPDPTDEAIRYAKAASRVNESLKPAASSSVGVAASDCRND
jgi:hypothetical protein